MPMMLIAAATSAAARAERLLAHREYVLAKAQAHSHHADLTLPILILVAIVVVVWVVYFIHKAHKLEVIKAELAVEKKTVGVSKKELEMVEENARLKAELAHARHINAVYRAGCEYVPLDEVAPTTPHIDSIFGARKTGQAEPAPQAGAEAEAVADDESVMASELDDAAIAAAFGHDDQQLAEAFGDDVRKA